MKTVACAALHFSGLCGSMPPMDQGLFDIAPQRLPRHVAIIMDGNGRWARARGLARSSGHQRGADVVRELTTLCAQLRRRLGRPDYLTLYSFSMENWKRPAEEVAFLMQMYIDYLQRERQTMRDNDIRYRQIGRLDDLPDAVQAQTRQTIDETANNRGLTLTLALNYGSRGEITDAVKAIARQVRDGTLEAEQIDESTIQRHLYTADMPDPDLLIRTAGEMRLSNYLLWQISYAELYVSPVCWPDFDQEQFAKALHSFSQRNRRFGGLEDAGA